nr:hypothetical protein [Tanacetum cinerariifolium]
MSLLQEGLDACAALTRRVEHLEHDKVAQDLEITKLKTRVKNLEKANKVKALKLRRLKKDDRRVDRDEGAAMMGEKEEEKAKKVKDIAGDAQVEGRQAEIQVKIYQIDMDHAVNVLSMQEDKPEVQEVVEVVTTTKLIIKAVTTASTPSKLLLLLPDEEDEWLSGIQKRYHLQKLLLKPSLRTRVKDVAIEKPKRIRMCKDTRLDYFKGMSYDDIRPIFEAKFNSNIEFLLKSKEQIKEEENRAIESNNETPAQKAAKRRKLNEEVEDLKQHLEIVPDEDDDVYTEATPLAWKVPVVDYQIIHFNKKPHYKIIHADGTHQLYMDKIKFGRVKGMILLVERRYTLSRFTLDQMLNTVRLQVEEQSEMSLKLLSFGVDAAMELEEKH